MESYTKKILISIIIALVVLSSIFFHSGVPIFIIIILLNFLRKKPNTTNTNSYTRPDSQKIEIPAFVPSQETFTPSNTQPDANYKRQTSLPTQHSGGNNPQLSGNSKILGGTNSFYWGSSVGSKFDAESGFQKALENAQKKGEDFDPWNLSPEHNPWDL